MYCALPNTLPPSCFPLTLCKFNLCSENKEMKLMDTGIIPFDEGYMTSSNTDICHLNASLMMPNQMFTHNSHSMKCVHNLLIKES